MMLCFGDKKKSNPQGNASFFVFGMDTTNTFTHT